MADDPVLTALTAAKAILAGGRDPDLMERHGNGKFAPVGDGVTAGLALDAALAALDAAKMAADCACGDMAGRVAHDAVAAHERSVSLHKAATTELSAASPAHEAAEAASVASAAAHDQAQFTAGFDPGRTDHAAAMAADAHDQAQRAEAASGRAVKVAVRLLAMNG